MEEKTYEDPQNPTELEKKHVPQIEITENKQSEEDMDIKITIGEIDHPMTDEHHIKWLKLMKDGEKVGEVSFSSKDEKAKAVIPVNIKKGDKLICKVNCNLHGLWYGETTY